MIKYLLLALTLFSSSLYADPVLTEQKVKDISKEMVQAIKDKDFSVMEKYMYPGSKITVDLDPANNRGEKEVSYEEFMMLTKMSMQMMGDAEIHDELLSISVDKEKNQATIEEKTTIVMEMMGMTLEDISIGKTTYGVIDGQIKVLSTEDQLISSGPISK